MPWTPSSARRTSGDLLQSLRNALPDIAWEAADAEGDDGMVYFTNGIGTRVKVKISREALEDYVDANNRAKSRKEQQLAACMREIHESALTEALIKAEHLAP